MHPTRMIRDGLVYDYDQVLIPRRQLRVERVFPFGRLKAPIFMPRIGRLGRLKVKDSVKPVSRRPLVITSGDSSLQRSREELHHRNGERQDSGYWFSTHPDPGTGPPSFVRTERVGMERGAPIRPCDSE